MHPLFRRAITRWRPMHWQLLLSMHLYLAPFCSVRVSPGCTIPLYHPAIPCALFLFLFSLPSLRTFYSFISLLSSILQRCPNDFNFLSFIRCMMFLVHLHLAKFSIFHPSLYE